MAQDPKAVQERLKELRADQLSFVSKELLEIPSQLNDTEDILALTSGIYGRNNKNWLIVATSERLLLLYKKKDLLAESYLPDSIGDCSLEKDKLYLTLSGEFIAFITINKEGAEHAQTVLRAIETLKADSSSSVSTQTPTESPLELSKEPEEKIPAPKPAPSATQEQEKKKSSTWVNVLVGILVIGGAYAFFSKDDKEAAPVEKAAEAPQTQSEATQQSPALVGHPLAVKIINYKEYERNGRNRLEITIIPAEDQSKATQADLAATAVAVATQAHKETEAPIVSVTMLCQKAANAYGEPQLAYVVYVADGLGMTGKTPGKIWEFLDAAPRGFTKQELKYLQLWAEMRENYMDKNGFLQSDKLKAAVAKKMKIKPDDINPHVIIREHVKGKLNIEGELKIVQ